MYNKLQTISKIFYACAGVFFALGIVIIRYMLNNMLLFDFDQYKFTFFCVILYVLCVPGIFAGLGIAINQINHALFEETLSRISQASDRK